MGELIYLTRGTLPAEERVGKFHNHGKTPSYQNNFPQDSLYLDISFFVAPRTMSSKNIPETFICARFKISRETTTRTRAGNNN